MATIAGSTTDRKTSERKFYSRMAIFLVVLVLLGFGPSFYLKGVVPAYPRPNPSLPPAVFFHGAIFTLWMAAIVAQTQLIRARRHQVHMRLGLLTIILGLILIPVMYLTTVWQIPRANQPPFTDPLTWTMVPLAVIIPFAVMLWNGWSRRRDPQWHKRSMLIAAILVVMGPAVARLPLAPPTLLGTSIMLALGLLLFVPLFLWDRRTIGHAHPATKLGFSLALLAVAVPLIVFWTGADWASIARHLPGIEA